MHSQFGSASKLPTMKPDAALRTTTGKALTVPLPKKKKKRKRERE